MHKVMYVVVFIAVFGCSGPREYHQGAAQPPPPPSMRPGVGAPTVGQPGWNPGVRTIPGPQHGRILPETPETRKEPGIWAAEPPRASKEDPSNPLTWDQFFYPKELDFKEALVGQECKEWVRDALTTVDLLQNGLAARFSQVLPNEYWLCVVATTYHHCVLGKYRFNEAARRKALVGAIEFTTSLKNLKNSADLLKQARCTDKLPPETAGLLQLLKQHIDGLQRSSSMPKN